MKVKDLIERLSTNYEPDTELIVDYWDKEIVESYGSPSLSKTQWSLVIEDYENGEWHFQSLAAEVFVEIAEKVVGDE
jgi:hypothetical protein